VGGSYPAEKRAHPPAVRFFLCGTVLGKTLHYYQFNIGDYASHTRHLTVIEDAAYRRLLDFYYLHEKPIKVHDIARQIGMREYEAEVFSVLDEFFLSTPDGFVNSRADKEIAHFHSKIEQASKAGKASAEQRLNKRSTDVQPTNNQEPITNNHKPIKPPLPPKGELFDLFWKAYPKKVGKDAAYKAFAKRKPDEQLVKTMIASVRKQADTEQWKKDGGQFIPHASTWLNEGRWQDETEIGAEQDWRLTRKGVESMAERLGLESWNQMCQFDQYRNTVLRTATERGMA